LIDAMIPIFKNVTRSLEVFYVLQGKKPCARLAMTDADEVISFCRLNDLACEVSDFRISMEFSGNYSTKGKKVGAKDPGYLFMYISKHVGLAKAAKAFEQKNDYAGLGRVLGYPECCIEFFCKNKPSEEKRLNDYVTPCIINTSSKLHFPYQNNIFIRYFDLALLSHALCSFDCKKSIAIANINLDILKELELPVYGHAISWLKSAAIYTDGGILLMQGHFKAEDQTYHVNDIIRSSDSSTLAALVSKIKMIKLVKIEEDGISVGEEKHTYPFLIFE
jgi:hypothetical protein